MVWIQIRTDILSVLIWVQTVCKGYQQRTKVAASKIVISIQIVKIRWQISDFNLCNSSNDTFPPSYILLLCCVLFIVPLALALLNQDTSYLENSVDPDQLIRIHFVFHSAYE